VKIYVALSVEGVPEISELRTQYDSLLNQVPSHLTLVFPVETNAVDFETVGVISNETSPIEVALTGPTGSVDHLMYMTLTQGNDSVIALHRRLYDECFTELYDRTYSYLPHITVGRFNKQQEMQSAIYDTPLMAPSSIRLDTMIIVEICTNGERKILETFALKGSNNGLSD
jgi:2'-5' RNA ligase